MTTTLPNFDELNLDSLDISMEQLQAKNEEYENETSGGGLSNDKYYAGDGLSTLRILMYFDSLKNSWQLERRVYIHKKFLGNISIPSLFKMHNMKKDGEDPIRALFFDLGGKYGYKDKKFKALAAAAGLYTKFSALVNVQVIVDCGDKGDKDFKRPEYDLGMVSLAGMNQTWYTAYLKIITNALYAGVTSPMKGSDWILNVGLNKETGFRDYGFSPAPFPRPLGKLDPRISSEPNVNRDPKEIMKECVDIGLLWGKPDADLMAKIHAKCEVVKGEISTAMESQVVNTGGSKAVESFENKQGQASTEGSSVIPPPPPDKPEDTKMDDGVSVGDEEKFVTPDKSATLVPVDNLAGKLAPTSNKDKDGQRLCFQKEVQDLSLAECQICEVRSYCKP